MLKKVRDLFIFSCFTGLSYVDIENLTKKSLAEHNGCIWIISRRKSPNTPIFGHISHNYLNIKLKHVISMCGIGKNISFHCARHTFATMALNNGMSLESLGQILGHSSIKTTQIYAKITIAKLDKDFSVLDSNISNIFW